MNNISTKAALFLFDAKSKFGKAKDYLGRKAKSIIYGILLILRVKRWVMNIKI